MDIENKKPTMNKKIFTMRLSIDATSLYILCCSLIDSDSVISTKNILELWNSTPAALKQSLEDLKQKNILREILSDGEDKKIYKLENQKKWLKSSKS